MYDVKKDHKIAPEQMYRPRINMGLILSIIEVKNRVSKLLPTSPQDWKWKIFDFDEKYRIRQFWPAQIRYLR